MDEYPGGSPDISMAVERWENEGGRFEVINLTPPGEAGHLGPAPSARRRPAEDGLRIEVRSDDDRGRNRIVRDARE